MLDGRALAISGPLALSLTKPLALALTKPLLDGRALAIAGLGRKQWAPRPQNPTPPIIKHAALKTAASATAAPHSRGQAAQALGAKAKVLAARTTQVSHEEHVAL